MGLIEQKEVQSTNNPIEWLLSGFHNDLGENHLECFSEIEISEISAASQVFIIAKSTPSTISTLFSFGYKTNLISIPATKVCFEEKTPTDSPFYLSDSPLRAPPFCA